MQPFAFDVLSHDAAARCGRISTPHGIVRTPVFMPVGTQGTVKGILPGQLEQLSAQILLANTYHLAIRPGANTVEALGGLHRMMGWKHPILTDSGGFQIFSLARLTSLSDSGAAFRSHVDGSLLELTPELAIAIQEQLGADIIMCLDVCPAAGCSTEQLVEAVDRTSVWAERCRRAQSSATQALFGIVQGGVDPTLRTRSAQQLIGLDFPGYAIGGLSVGESPEQMNAVLDHTVAELPWKKPRYLMGVGRPQDILEAVARGIDMFDCVMPTRNGRNATAFTAAGPLRLRNAAHATDRQPIEPGCDCPACSQFSRGTIRHYFQAGEMLGPILVSLHNLRFLIRLTEQIRDAIEQQCYAEYRADTLARLGP